MKRSDKSAYLGKGAKGNVNQGNRLGQLAPKRTLTLSSGKVVNLVRKTINGKMAISKGTCVDTENARNQDDLTAEALSDITETIATTQLYPAIGYEYEGMIYVVDGSRRRMAAILMDCDLQVEVADQALNALEAHEIVKLSEKKQSLSDRDWGSYYLAKLEKLSQDGEALTQAEFAKREGVSVGVMNRRLNAAQVHPALYDLFISAACINSAVLSNQLIKINKQIIKDEQDIDDVSSLVGARLMESPALDSPEEHTEQVFALLRTVLDEKQKTKVGRKKKNPERRLFNGKKDKVFITYQEISPHKASITLSRISADKREKINDFIATLMADTHE